MPCVTSQRDDIPKNVPLEHTLCEEWSKQEEPRMEMNYSTVAAGIFNNTDIWGTP